MFFAKCKVVLKGMHVCPRRPSNTTDRKFIRYIIRYLPFIPFLLIPNFNFIVNFFSYSKSNENGIEIIDPYDAGIDVLDLNQGHHRSQRSIWDGLHFRLEAPSVDWQKRVGSKSIGASFGIVMMNFLDLAIG